MYSTSSTVHVPVNIPIYMHDCYTCKEIHAPTVLRKQMFSLRAPTVPKKEMMKMKAPTAIITAAGSVEMLENSL